MNLLKNKEFTRYVVKFILIFAILYFGTLAWIGFAAPGGLYSPFIAEYLDYVKWIRISLLEGSKWLLSLFDIDTYRTTDFRLRFPQGRGVIMAYDCVGYGVMSFWIAFVFASTVPLVKKFAWTLLGITVIWFINISRVSLLLVAINRKWAMPLGWDHHTWFNIVAYIAIFTMMYFFDKKRVVISKE